MEELQKQIIIFINEDLDKIQGFLSSLKIGQHGTFYSRHSNHVEELINLKADLSWLQNPKEISINKRSPVLYLVKWKNLSYLHSTWETEDSL